jgi:hypothetical protein
MSSLSGILRTLSSVLLLWGATAQAALDVTCQGRGCLVDGWTIHESTTGRSQWVTCQGSDCANFGWVESAAGFGAIREYRCKAGGCFASGWDVADLQRRLWIDSVVCSYETSGFRDCFTNGWTSGGVQSPPVRVSCIDDDCQVYGWTTQGPYNNWSQATCKPGGCFWSGWTVD